MIVIDASLALELLLATPRGLRHSEAVLGEERHAPTVLDLEFAQALRRLTLTGGLSPERAGLALHLFCEWALIRHAHTPFLPRIWALRRSVSAYDAAYVALAEGLSAPLLTCDAKLARSHGHGARVVLLE